VVSGAKPQPTHDLVHIGVKKAALMAADFVDFLCKGVDGMDLELGTK